MKILCIHGFRSSGDILYKSLDSLQKKLKKDNIYFDCVTSPTHYIKTNNETSDFQDNKYYQWWSTSRENLFDEHTYDSIYESIEYIYNMYQNDNYDGILGYSQGSILTQIILYLQEHSNLFEQKYHKFKFNFKFGILACTFNITDNVLKNIYSHKLSVPILNIYGSNDELVPFEISKSFSDKCINIMNFEHRGKHYVPTTLDMKNILIAFLTKVESVTKN